MERKNCTFPANCVCNWRWAYLSRLGCLSAWRESFKHILKLSTWFLFLSLKIIIWHRELAFGNDLMCWDSSMANIFSFWYAFIWLFVILYFCWFLLSLMECSPFQQWGLQMICASWLEKLLGRRPDQEREIRLLGRWRFNLSSQQLGYWLAGVPSELCFGLASFPDCTDDLASRVH